MALEHNAIKYAVNLTRGFKRLFGVDDNEQSVTRLSETLGIDVDPFRAFDRPEFSYPLGEFLWVIQPTQSAVALEHSFCGIQNPAKSGLIIVIEEWSTPNNVAGGVVDERIVANSSFIPTATGTPTQRDLRVPNFPNPSLGSVSFAFHQAADLGTLLSSHTVVTGTRYQPRVVLLPGFSWFIEVETVNVALSVNIWGRERRAYPGELLSS